MSQLEVERGQHAAIVRCSGQFVGGDETDTLRNVLTGLMEDYKDIILDMAAVRYVNSSFLSTLLSVQTAMSRRSGHVALAGLNDSINTVLTTTRMDQILKIYGTVGEALKSTTQEQQSNNN